MEAINDSLAMSPLHPCVECGKRVQKNSKAVQCESCDKWCHIRCGTRIDATTYQQVVEGNVDLFWFCRVVKKVYLSRNWNGHFSCLIYHLAYMFVKCKFGIKRYSYPEVKWALQLTKML